jgi:tetratricopeptide (TPR) repeat protein
MLLAPVAAQSPEESFRRGNAAYEQGRYDDAARAYHDVLRYGVRDVRVEYNLANAEFRSGRLGLAILHYERAHRLDPVDPDVLANLEYARAQCVDRVEAAPEPALLRAVHGLQDRLGPDRQAWLFVAACWLVAALVTWCTARPGGWTPAGGWVLAASLLAASLVAASWQATLRRLDDRRFAVVTQQVADVLAGPGENNATLFTVHEGLTLRVRAEREDWMQVGLPNGLNGWIADRAVERL